MRVSGLSGIFAVPAPESAPVCAASEELAAFVAFTVLCTLWLISPPPASRARAVAAAC